VRVDLQKAQRDVQQRINPIDTIDEPVAREIGVMFG
jgi:hypothetical protein